MRSSLAESPNRVKGNLDRDIPITRRDGTVYRLRAPNPLGATQSSWNSDVEKINFKWTPIVVPDDGEFVPIQSDFRVSDKILELSPVTVVEEPEELPPPEPEKPSPPVQSTERESVRPYLSNTVHMHCLPVEVTSHSDDLYGDQFQRNSYGQKFIFEAIMVSMGDLAMEFWTDTDRVAEKSIVYPFRRRTAKGKYESLQQYRWWKVTDIEEKSTGYLMRAVASDIQPDFS